MNVYTRYENGKNKKDYYHEYLILIPWELWHTLGDVAKDRKKSIAALVRGYILRGLEKDGYDIMPFLNL